MKFTLLAADAQHPNRLPFEGVLTFYDVPSENPVGGANGLRVLIPSSVGIPALSTLEGMGVNVDDSYTRHNKKKKIGVIEAATAGDADENGAVPVYVRGYLYAKDFPDEVADLQAEKDDLGFSYEAEATGDVEGGVYRATSVLYSGATILYKNKAAYTRTSLAAGKDDNMNEFLKMFLQAMGVDDPAVQTAEDNDDAADSELTRQAFTQLAEAVNMFREFKELFGDDGKYASLNVCLSAAAENQTKVEDLTTALAAANEKIEALTSDLAEAKTSLTASADVNLEGYVKVEQYDELKAQADEMKTKVDELVAEAGEKAAYDRKSQTFPMTLSAHYGIDEKGDLQAQREAIGKRDDIDPATKLTKQLAIDDMIRQQAK